MGELDTIRWDSGVKLHNPRSMFGGVRIIESPYLPEDKAYMMPDGAMIVPPGYTEKVRDIDVKNETVDVSSFGDGYIQRQQVIGGQSVTATTIDGDTLNVEKMERMIAEHRQAMDKQIVLAMFGSPEPRDHLADVERTEMEADPAWGSF